MIAVFEEKQFADGTVRVSNEMWRDVNLQLHLQTGWYTSEHFVPDTKNTTEFCPARRPEPPSCRSGVDSAHSAAVRSGCTRDSLYLIPARFPL